jgi:uncharacterized protein involved in exopolysaccharide biosynthesis
LLGGWPWVVVITTIAGAAMAYAASFLIPPEYRSHARVLVTPQSIPERFVEPATRVTFDERVRMARSIILSDQNLEATILAFDLDNPDSVRNNRAAIARMRRDITIEANADGRSLEVAYASTDPRMALMVTERLTSLFLRANARSRDDIRSSLQRLDTEIEEARSRLLAWTGHSGRALEHDALRATYRDLLMKKEQAMLSAALEVRQLGEQVVIVDGARLPDAPVSPDRARLTLLGAILGFCLGIAMMIAGRNGSSRRPRKMLVRT